MTQISAAILPVVNTTGPTGPTGPGDATSAGKAADGSVPASFASLLNRSMSARPTGGAGPSAPGKTGHGPVADGSVKASAAASQQGLPSDPTVVTEQAAVAGLPPAQLVAALMADKVKAGPKAGEANAAKDANSNGQPGQGLDAAGQALLQSMAVPAVASGMDKAAVATTVAGNSNASSRTDTVSGTGQGGGGGKNLPVQVAGLAAQHAGHSTGTDSNSAGQGQTGGQNSVPPDMKFMTAFSAKTGDTSVLPAVQSSPGHAQVSQAGAAPTTDGQVLPLISTAVPAHAVTQAQPPAVGGAAGNPPMTMQSTFGSTGWTQEFGDKMVWMAGNNGHTSQLILNPPSLGTVEVRLHVNGNDAGAQFFAANADVRNAIEAAMPKLREMLAGAGIALGEAMVSNQSFSQREPFQRQSQQPAQKGGGRTADSLVGGISGVNLNSVSLAIGAGGSGLVDYYA